jgi:hypothetical protein
MVDINIGNVVTIGIISIASYAAVKFVLTKTGYAPSWM